jgi:hypothetical protein
MQHILFIYDQKVACNLLFSTRGPMGRAYLQWPNLSNPAKAGVGAVGGGVHKRRRTHVLIQLAYYFLTDMNMTVIH